jgi:hypothetical protein
MSATLRVVTALAVFLSATALAGEYGASGARAASTVEKPVVGVSR